VPLFAEDGSYWQGVAVFIGAVATALAPVLLWAGKQWERRGQHAEVDRDARIADLKERLVEKDRHLAAKDQQIAAREESCRLCRTQADDQVKTVIRLHEICGNFRALAEAAHGCMRLSNERLRHANARLVKLGEAPEDVPDEPKLWFPDRAEAEFLTRSVAQGQMIVEAVQAEARRHALPAVPPAAGAGGGG
jgi:hypothetical protein